jgi:hypothetical protein
MTSEVRPSRVLDLGEDEDPLVRLTGFPDAGPDQGAKYVALSYCWGSDSKNQRGKCTKANIEDLQRGILIHDLPRTIQDAVQVCRKLGFKYLWVDRLCIIQKDGNQQNGTQEDDNDMNKELSKMMDIYGNAHLVLSAACAENSEQGFLYDREPSKAYGNIWKVVLDGPEEKGSALLCENGLRNKFEEVIEKRAWTMQEHIMAFRLLRYGSKQIEWTCPQMYKTDGGVKYNHIQEDNAFFTERVETRRALTLRRNMIKDEWLDHFANMNSWMSILSRYSRRQIGRQCDRLRACTALAAGFARTIGWDPASYFAGLWESEFVLQLLWYPAGKVDTMTHLCSECPSWSWASFPGPIDFFQMSGYPTEARLRNMPQVALSDNGNHFGHIDGGCLTIEGHLQQCCRLRDGLRHTESHGSDIETYYCVHMYWDQELFQILEKFWFLVIADTKKSPTGLILRLMEQPVPRRVHQSDSRDTFQRVGYFRYHGLSDPLFKRDALVEVIKTTISPEDLCRHWQTLDIM